MSITKKVDVEGRAYDLKEKFQASLDRFKRHSFNISNQISVYNHLKNNLSEEECLIHVDFSENWKAKLHREIQSRHFGASQNQVTLHTGVYFVGSSQEAHTFSDNCNHGPAGIWAHLKPILDQIQKNHSSVKVMDFFSDGPTSQYRSKTNICMFTNIMAQRGIKHSTWNYHESGQGKGVPGGVGATVKRNADALGIDNAVVLTMAAHL